MMTTTTGGAARDGVARTLAANRMARFRVYLLRDRSLGDCGGGRTEEPRRRASPVCDHQSSREAFPFMAYRDGKVASVAARVMRISSESSRSK